MMFHEEIKAIFPLVPICTRVDGDRTCFSIIIDHFWLKFTNEKEAIAYAVANKDKILVDAAEYNLKYEEGVRKREAEDVARRAKEEERQEIERNERNRFNLERVRRCVTHAKIIMEESYTKTDQDAVVRLSTVLLNVTQGLLPDD